jgi:hypothetical protein
MDDTTTYLARKPHVSLVRETLERPELGWIRHREFPAGSFSKDYSEVLTEDEARRWLERNEYLDVEVMA